MRYIENDWQVRKLIQIYESYFNPLKGRTQREGPDYLFHAFKAVLDYERLPIWQMDETLMPISNGGSYFLLDERYLIDLVLAETLDEDFIIQHLRQTPDIGDYDYTGELIILNFGGQTSEWYPFEPEEDLP
ncbi:MAG: hypothetical protein HN855_06070 [Anaerolineae bacterium]|nr:hypothetical protein [Anaerolineae bacterium]MBT7324705.1 hypothetical protein [Anaerolineae bacterium]